MARMMANSPTLIQPFTQARPILRHRQSYSSNSTTKPSIKGTSSRSLVASAVNHHRQINTLRNIDWPEALLFDCDGVLVDTEAEGHRVAFNEAFKRKGLLHEWGLEQYGELLEIGGGKERMNAYFTVRY